MKVIAIDPGIVNYAITLLEYNNENDWNVIHSRLLNCGTKATTKMQVVHNLCKNLDSLYETFDFEKVDKVFIETQPRKFEKLTSVFYATVMYFSMLGKYAESIDSNSKWKMDCSESPIKIPKGKKNHPVRKKLGIAFCRAICEAAKKDSELERLREFSKLDDISDTILIGLYSCGYKYKGSPIKIEK